MAQFAGSNYQTHEHVNLFANSHDIVTDVYTVPNGVTLLQYQVCGIHTANKTIHPHDPTANDGTEVAAVIVEYANDGSAQREVSAFKGGAFNIDLLEFHASLNTDALKANAFKYAGSAISAQKLHKRH